MDVRLAWWWEASDRMLIEEERLEKEKEVDSAKSENPSPEQNQRDS